MGASRNQIEETSKRLCNEWRSDWVRFCTEAFGVTLDRDQAAILRAVQSDPRVSVASGTARGKDFIAACAAMCFLYLTPRWKRTPSGIVLAENTKVAMTAPTDRQVLNIMMPEISRLFNRARNRGIALPGRLNTQNIRTQDAEWFLTGFKADEYNHEAWSGFHAVHTMFVVTEATGISDDTFSAIEGNLQGDSRILIVFNPNVSVGYAANSQKSERWTRFRLNSLTAPNVEQKRIVIPGQVDYNWVVDKVENWCTPITAHEATAELDDFEFEDKWYRPEDVFRKKVLGCFPKVSDDALIPLQWLEIAHKRWRENRGTEHGDINGSPRVMGVDVAGMGRDSSVFCDRQGPLVRSFEVYNSAGRADQMKIAGEIAAMRRREPEMYASIDTIGEGAGVYSRLLETDADSSHIISCKFSAAARSDIGKDLCDITGQYRFVNMRAYLFWCVRDWLNPKNETGAMLPPDDALDEEATEIRWEFRSDGKIIIEPKDDIKHRLGRSTDRFDALANTFYPITSRRNIDLRRIARLINR